jgi:DNA-directed RNA polymerase subunit beta'
MRAIDLYVNSVLPPDLRSNNRVLNKKNIESVLADVARRYPEQYADISKSLSDIGRKAAYLQGETLNLSDFQPVLDRDGLLKQMDHEVRASDAETKNPDEREKKRLIIWAKYSTAIEKSTSENARHTNLGRSVTSGARGNALQLKAILSTPALYTDYKDRVIPMFIRHGFGEGLRPAEYLASSFGTRRSVISTKSSTARGGDFMKQIIAATTPIIVTEDDCGTSNGLDFDVTDHEIQGRVLAKEAGGVAVGTTIDKHVIQALHKAGVKRIIARSPMTCTSKSGICSHCLGTLPSGHFAPRGYTAGTTAAQAVGEPVVSGALAAKHTGGSFKGSQKQFAGFDTITQLVQSPETFPNKAPLAETSGKVDSIEDAPQGGKYVTIGENKHYLLPDFAPLVKVGDTVEAGTPLSEGVADVADVVRLRGLGEGRRYYVDRLKQAMEESGAGHPSKLNLELIARGTLDHVKIDDPDGLGGYLPDDVVSYGTMSNSYVQPKSATMMSPDQAVDKYLHAPVLHFTIGTKMTPKMIDRLKSAGIKGVVASGEEQPKFHPEMVRLRAAAHNNPDWLARMHSSYLMSNLDESASRGRDTDTMENTHFAPRLAIGKNFGKNIDTTGKF